MEFDIRRYLSLLIKWWWLLAIGVIVPVVVSFYFASKQPALYRARVVLMVGTTLQSTNPDAYEIGIAERLARGYAEMVKYRPVTNGVIQKLGLNQTPEGLAEQIVAFVRSEANLLELWVTDENPRAAALIANALADELIRQSPGSSQAQAEQQNFIEQQLNDLQVKIKAVEQEIEEKTASLVNLTSAAEIQTAQEYLSSQETVASLYRSQYAQYLTSYTESFVNQLSIVEPAIEPTYPIGSKTKMILGIAGLAGLALSMAAVFVIEFLDDTVKWEGSQDKKVTGMSVLGAVARMPSSKGAILARGSERSTEAEAIRALRTNLFLSRRRTPYRSILVTSCNSREGKSFVVANLGVALATAGLRTVIVDGDMRHPSQHAIFDLPNFFGLADLLDRSVSANDLASARGVQATEVKNLSLLSAGRVPLDPAILLTSPNLALLMRALQERADIVLLDSPPMLAVPDTSLLASEAGATLIVVNDGITSRADVNKVKKELLQLEDVNVLGVAFNNVKLRGGSHYYYGAPARRPVWNRLLGQLAMLGIGLFGANGHAPDDPDHTLDLKEMAEYLGIQLHTARRWCQDGRIPAFKSGRHWQVRRGDLQAMVLNHLSGEVRDEETMAFLEPSLPPFENRN
ncbi:MAG: polysaccharide biosynthesis tyrosine autokinase [Chloroflexota bacterium]